MILLWKGKWSRPCLLSISSTSVFKFNPSGRSISQKNCEKL